MGPPSPMTQSPRQLHFHLILIHWVEYKAALCLSAATVSSHLDDMPWFFFFMCGIRFVAHILMVNMSNKEMKRMKLPPAYQFISFICIYIFSKEQEEKVVKRISVYFAMQCTIITCLSGVCGLDVPCRMECECAYWRCSGKHLNEQVIEQVKVLK